MKTEFVDVNDTRKNLVVDGEMIDYPVAYRAQALIDSVRKAR